VQVRRDHVAGAALLLAGAGVLAASTDLPFGTLASPGAGMLPTVVVVVMMALAAVLVLTGGASPPMRDIAWGDAPHALRLLVVTGAAIAAYTWLGFIASMLAMLFVLTFLVERKPFLAAAGFSIGAAALAYLVFAILLNAPLPRGSWH
jgi:Tripartite tricarboxylate transporter TctB family